MKPLEETSSVSGSTIGIATGKSSSDMENSKLVLAVVLILGCCSLVAIVLAAVAISKNNDSRNITVGGTSGGSPAMSGGGQAPIVISSGGGGATGSGGRRIFTIATGHDWGAHNYFDKEGYITGFSKELVEAVCEAAGIDCRTVWDKWTNCWDSTAGEHSMGGRGLLDGWYDGCMGWAKAVNRMQTFAFGTAYLRLTPSHFYVKKGSSFDPTDIRGKKIGFMDGWAYDEKCIARQKDILGNELPVDKIVHYLQVQDAIDSLLNGTVDALSGDDTVYKQWLNQIESKGSYQCLLGGNTMMTRKDNDFLRYWNAGFAKIQSSGQFTKMCDDAATKHADYGPVHCV